MEIPDRIRSDFVRMIDRPESTFELAHTALLVAAESDPELDVSGVLDQLNLWSDEFNQRLDPSWNNLQKLARLRAFAFDHLGFRGDHADYYSPSNSLLNEVMHRRKGIPLTLSILFLELGWRAGMPFEGVGFPGHFLVRLPGEEKDLLLDPYRRGMTVREEDCRQMLLETTGGKLAFDDALLASVTKRDMIARLLLNLKAAYLRQDEDEMALSAVERLLLIHPEDLDEIRDRGLLRYRLRRFGLALDDLRTYLQARPNARDHDAIAQHALHLRRILASLN